MQAPLVVPLSGWREPIEILRLFAADPMPALLHSGPAPQAVTDINRWSILCASPYEVLSWSHGSPPDPFELLDKAVSRNETLPAGEYPFAGGAIGFIGYETGRALESIRPAAGKHTAISGTSIPDLLFGIYPWALTWDHHQRRWAIVSTGLPERGSARLVKARADAETVRRRLERPARPAPGRPPVEEAQPILATSVPRDRYLSMVAKAKGQIAEGEFYQVNLSQRLELPAPADPLRMFEEIARHSPAPFSAWIDAGRFQVASASPERFCSLRGRAAEIRPIKGTRSRGVTPGEDAARARELAASAKDRAENVMIVDLVRNDLGRVCTTGSVKAIDVCRLETYASVHHLISIVTGELAPGRGRAELLRAVFPGGSMTGAPKVRAMQAIEELEPVPRGIYSGALGYLSFCGSMDLNIVIRTAVVADGRAWLSVGGGVVADSEPEAEWQETLDKAESVLRGMRATWPASRRPEPGTATRQSDR